jgi:DNA-binding XRE family transcriptional regulator
MDKRFKPMTPSEQMAARLDVVAAIRARPGMPLPEALVLIRKRLRLTNHDLARISGLSKRFIIDTVSGKGNPSIKTASTLLRPFGFSIGVTVVEPDMSDS